MVSTTMEGLCQPVTGRGNKTYTMEEVRRLGRERGECWVVLAGKAYNASAYKNHPGGFEIVQQCAGSDCTDAFAVNHPPHVLNILKHYYIGDVVDSKEPNAVMQDFHKLDTEFERQGLYHTRLSFYAKLAVWLAVLFSVALLPFTGLVAQTWVSMTVSACALGLFWQQFAFIGHDAGHNAVFHDRTGGDYGCSMIVVFFFGVSGQWWKQNHNVHHVSTNSINADPDIQYLPLFMVNSKMVHSFYSVYHKTKFVYDKVAQSLVSVQHYMYFPVMALARHNLYLQSWIFVLTGRDVRNRWVEVCCLLGYAWWLAELVLRIEDSRLGWWWWLLAHGVCGLLHVQITLSHFAMESYERVEGTVMRDLDDDFVRHQLATSLDVDCSESMDWLHGGLQYQVVHHLWPRIPRHNLRYVRDTYLIPLCKKHGLTYHKKSFFDCVALTVKHLKEQAAVAARTPPGSAMIVQAMNLEG